MALPADPFSPVFTVEFRGRIADSPAPARKRSTVLDGGGAAGHRGGTRRRSGAQAVSKAADFPVLCSWCLAGGVRTVVRTSEVENSHGICETHAAAIRAEIQSRKDLLKNTRNEPTPP